MRKDGSPPTSRVALRPPGFYLYKIDVFETKNSYCLVGWDVRKTSYRVLEVDRMPRDQLNLREHHKSYTRDEAVNFLKFLDVTSKSTGGLKRLTSCYGLLGFFRLTSCYYMLLIKKRVQVGNIGRHRVFAIKKTKHYTVPHYSIQEPLSSEEKRYKRIFFSLELSDDFYWSPTYDLTSTMQANSTRPRRGRLPFNETFCWNHYLLSTLVERSVSAYWMRSVICGAYAQKTLDLIGRNVCLVLIARRSRFYAGTRYLKRGCDERGHASNDVEIEQVLSNSGLGVGNERFVAYVQHRASIPLFWSEQLESIMPKLPIVIQKVDPFYSATILHFMDLMTRYGNPVIILNLVKSKESICRETLLRSAFQECVQFVNSTITQEDAKILYISWDFKKAAKGSKFELYRDMKAIARLSLLHTRMFCSEAPRGANFRGLRGRGWQSGGDQLPKSRCLLQRGVVRTNCVDSIDRTSAAQYLIGLSVLAKQLYVLELSKEDDDLAFDSDLAFVLMKLYEIIGHRLALQYGGSGLAHTVETFTNSSIVGYSLDFLKTLQRRYRNTFTDQEKQRSINLFLGVFRPWEQKSVHLWDMESDYLLHHGPPPPEKDPISSKCWWKRALQLHEGIDCATEVLSEEESEKIATDERQTAFDTNLHADFYQTFKLTSFDKHLLHKFRKPIRMSLFSRENSDIFKKRSAGNDGAKNNIMKWFWHADDRSVEPTTPLTSKKPQFQTEKACHHISPSYDSNQEFRFCPPFPPRVYSNYLSTAESSPKQDDKKSQRRVAVQFEQFLSFERRTLTPTATRRVSSTYQQLVSRWTHLRVVQSDLQIYNECVATALEPSSASTACDRPQHQCNASYLLA
ncbi:uncharacterized protein LOC126317078 [Schistocerca gregaria]|uniref:uncharacterized protein LOC126317078 n=1 Tax=Schistocerca gregaria TaxID=7010 RepID=UPI00211E6352|nr:uncharacterized protein LOC126317078 [Schistocerca gregaria]